MINNLVSILIPTFERKEMTDEAILCALNQTYKNIEIIVVDNDSKDGSYEYLKEKYKNYFTIKFYKNEENIGPVENWKMCLNKAKGEYIKFLWSDDLISNNYIEKTVNELNKNSFASFAYTATVIANDLSEVKKKIENGDINYRLGLTGSYDGKLFIEKTYRFFGSVPVSPGCAIFRKNKLQIITEIDNSIGYCHKDTGAGTDLLMFLESLSNDGCFIYIDEPLCVFRAHNKSITCYDKNVILGYITSKIYYLIKYNNKMFWNELYYDIIGIKKIIPEYKKYDNKEMIDLFIRDKRANYNLFFIICTKAINKINKYLK